MVVPLLSPIDEPTIANPPRFRWLIRLSIVYAIALIGAIAGWFAWNAAADRMMAAEIARVRALGEPILPDDFNAFQPWPATQNALTYIASARAINATRDQSDMFSYDDSIRLNDKEIATLKTFPTVFAQNLSQLRAARPFKAQRVAKVNTPMINLMLPHLSQERTLANVVQGAIYARHAEGNDAEAVELMRDLLHLGNTLDQRAFTLVEHLVAVGIDSMSANMVMKYGQSLAVEKPASTTQPSSPAARQQIKDFIAELLDESSLTAGQIAAFQGERAMELDSAVSLADSPSALGRMGLGSPSGATPLSVLMGPSFKISGVRCSESTSKLVEGAKNPALPKIPTGRPKLSRVEQPMTQVTRMSRMVEMLLSPSLFRALEVHQRVAMERRVAATQLAIRLYQLDHAGQFPAKLDELVPQYLPAIPIDPFSPDGHAIRYVRDGMSGKSPSPLLYSVNSNRTDDHASTKPADSIGRTRFRNQWNEEDAVFPLIPPPLKEREPEPQPEPLWPAEESTMEPTTEPTTVPAD